MQILKTLLGRSNDRTDRDRADGDDIPDALVHDGSTLEGPQFARRYINDEPLLGSREDRQRELERAALAFVLLNDYGQEFLCQANGLDVCLTREECEELREATADRWDS